VFGKAISLSIIKGKQHLNFLVLINSAMVNVHQCTKSYLVVLLSG